MYRLPGVRSLTRAGVLGAILLALLGVTGCGDEDNREAVIHRAAAIERGDECHLCGMIINNFAGPKGEIFDKGQPQAKKFCSTRDLFSYLLQPENHRQAQAVFVHDMAKAPWDKPGNHDFVRAEQAWYVINQSRKAAMGPTLASFELRADAELFQQQYGGRVVGFDEITLELVTTLTAGK